MNKKHLFLFFVFFIFSNFAECQIISTIAGNGLGGYGAFSGDGGPATAAELFGPEGIVADSFGNIYFWGNYRIRKIAPTGIISTIAGNGIDTIINGDGGAATLASIGFSWGLATDKIGNLYITDDFGDRIRKINMSSGIITTIAGTGTTGFSGDGGPATLAQISAAGIATDIAGNIYICDGGNFRIRKINTSGIISTIAGTGTSGYSGDGGQASAAQMTGPGGAAVDKNGNIYFTDFNNYCIRKINPAGIITTIAGTPGTLGFSGDSGPATAARMYYAKNVATDTAGNVYFGDMNNSRVRKVNITTGIINTIAGDTVCNCFGGDGGPATAAQLFQPQYITLDKKGEVYISENGNNRIRKIDYSKLGISEINIVQKGVVTIKPNPAESGLFTVKVTSANNEPVHITVTNITGVKIKELTSSTNTNTCVQLNSPSGVYFVTVNTAGESWSEKVVVN